jgi:hypothetical protein
MIPATRMFTILRWMCVPLVACLASQVGGALHADAQTPPRAATPAQQPNAPLTQSQQYALSVGAANAVVAAVERLGLQPPQLVPIPYIQPLPVRRWSWWGGYRGPTQQQIVLYNAQVAAARAAQQENQRRSDQFFSANAVAIRGAVTTALANFAASSGLAPEQTALVLSSVGSGLSDRIWNAGSGIHNGVENAHLKTFTVSLLSQIQTQASTVGQQMAATVRQTGSTANLASAVTGAPAMTTTPNNQTPTAAIPLVSNTPAPATTPPTPAGPPPNLGGGATGGGGGSNYRLG